jgi:hypothetical protein
MLRAAAVEECIGPFALYICTLMIKYYLNSFVLKELRMLVMLRDIIFTFEW